MRNPLIASHQPFVRVQITLSGSLDQFGVVQWSVPHG